MPQPGQPIDYAPGWDPFRTDPLYAQSITEEEVIRPQEAVDHRGKHKKRQKSNRAKAEAFDCRPEGPACEPTPETSSHEESTMPKLFDFLVPPIHDTPENIRRHRIALSLAVMILFVHVGLACGLFQKMGFSGFASAATVNKITIKLLERDIFETRTSQCKATTDDSRQFYGKKLIELLREYREETKEPYPLPSCRELGAIE